MQQLSNSSIHHKITGPGGGCPAPCERAGAGQPSTGPAGGRMTISPPANVKSQIQERYPIYASGFDSLYLAIDAHWANDGFLRYLQQLKEKAVALKEDALGLTKPDELNQCWPFLVKPHGTEGYEWLLSGNDMALKIGNWLKPISRPSLMAELRSEWLWRVGPGEAVYQLISLLQAQGANGIVVKPSRVDLCCDLLFPESCWNKEIIDYAVTRAKYMAPHHYDKILTGISIGKGKLSFRMYDKPLEIRQKSKKIWMYDVWKLNEIPDGQKMVRCEFQFRREALVELGINQWDDLLGYCDSLWAYATDLWLKFCDRPGKHHTQRNLLPWWAAVQKGFLGVQDATPAIRGKAINAHIDGLRTQAVGLLSSVAALQMEKDGIDLLNLPTLFTVLEALYRGSPNIEKQFQEDALQKRFKYHRGRQKWEETCQLRRELGLPTNEYRRGK